MAEGGSEVEHLLAVKGRPGSPVVHRHSEDAARERRIIIFSRERIHNRLVERVGTVLVGGRAWEPDDAPVDSRLLRHLLASAMPPLLPLYSGYKRAHPSSAPLRVADQRQQRHPQPL